MSLDALLLGLGFIQQHWTTPTGGGEDGSRVLETLLGPQKRLEVAPSFWKER